jgi:hypothetical protein
VTLNEPQQKSQQAYGRADFTLTSLVVGSPRSDVFVDDLSSCPNIEMCANGPVGVPTFSQQACRSRLRAAVTGSAIGTASRQACSSMTRRLTGIGNPQATRAGTADFFVYSGRIENRRRRPGRYTEKCRRSSVKIRVRSSRSATLTNAASARSIGRWRDFSISAHTRCVAFVERRQRQRPGFHPAPEGFLATPRRPQQIHGFGERGPGGDHRIA